MHPPVFGISKSAPAGGLTIGGYHIPANTMVVVSVYHESLVWSLRAQSNIDNIILVLNIMISCSFQLLCCVECLSTLMTQIHSILIVLIQRTNSEF